MTEQQEETKRDRRFLMKKSGLALLVRAAGMLTQYLFVFVTARLLGAQVLGTFTLSYTIVQLVAILSLMGLDNLLVRTIAAEKARHNYAAVHASYRQFFRITAVSSVCWTVLLYLSAPWLSLHVFQKPQLSEALQVIAISLPPFVLMLIDSAAFRGYKNMVGFAIFRALIPFLGAAFVGAAYFMQQEFSPNSCFTLATFIVSAISYMAWHRFSKPELPVQVSTEKWHVVVGHAMPMMLTGSLFFILGWTDNLILGIFRPEAEVGIYDTAFKIAAASAIALLGMNAIQAPVFAELFSKGEHDRLKRYVFQSTRIIFYITFPITILLLLFPEWILGIFGAEFKIAGTALVIMAIGNFVNCITGSVGILLQMTGHQKPYNRIISFTAMASIALNFILIPKWGLTGAAISSAAAKIFQNTAAVIYTKKHLGIVSVYLPGIHRFVHTQKNAK